MIATAPVVDDLVKTSAAWLIDHAGFAKGYALPRSAANYKEKKMATYSMGDLKKGLKIELDGVPYKVVEYQHVKPGKGAAFVRAKIKSFIDGKVLEKTFHAGDKCD